MNNTIKRTWNQNSMVIIEDLQGMAFQAESGGHTFQISGIDGEGNAVALSGTPAGVMLRADGQDVALTCSVSGGVVSATLPANAYNVPGRFGLTIFLTSDGQKTAIYAAVGTVGKTSSGTVAPPAGSDVVDLVNQINTAIAAIPANYNACFAPAYSTSGLYSVGQYVTYNGNLYRCNTAITTAETWTAAHWTQTNLGADVYDLKSAFNADIEDIGYGETAFQFVQGKRTASNPETVASSTTRITTKNAIKAKAGDVIKVTGSYTGVKYAIGGKASTDYDGGWMTDDYTYVVDLDGIYYVNAAKTNGSDTIVPSDVSIIVKKINKTSEASVAKDAADVADKLNNSIQEIAFIMENGSLAGNVGEEISFSSTETWQHSSIAVQKGEVYELKVKSRGQQNVFFVWFTDDDDKILQKDYSFSPTEHPNVTDIIFQVIVPNLTGLKKMYFQGYTEIAYVKKRITEEESVSKEIENITESAGQKVLVTDGYNLSKYHVRCVRKNDTTVRILGKRSETAGIIFDCLNGQNGAFKGNETEMQKNIAQGKYICHIGNFSGATLSYTESTVRNRVNIADGDVVDVPAGGGSFFIRVGTGSEGDLVDIEVNFSVYEYPNDHGLLSSARIAVDPVARLSGQNGIPSYYASHLDTWEENINELYNITKNPAIGIEPDESLQFIFFTDYHYDPASGNGGDNNTRNSPALMKHIMEATGASFILFGGDIPNSVQNNNDHKYLMPCFTDFKKTFGSLTEKMFSVYGNHEFNCVNAQKPSYGELYHKLNAQNEMKIGNLDGYGDYTVDLPNNKVRLICCNATDRISSMGLKEAQCEWFTARLADKPTGYDVVFMTHRMLNYTLDTVNQEIDWSLWNDVEPITEAIAAYEAQATSETGHVICCICGHVHMDTSMTLECGVPIIVTTSDSCRKRYVEYDWSTSSWVFGENFVGTYQEQAFDVVTIDKENKKIYLNRIGYGSDRTFTYGS